MTLSGTSNHICIVVKYIYGSINSLYIQIVTFSKVFSVDYFWFCFNLSIFLL